MTATMRALVIQPGDHLRATLRAVPADVLKLARLEFDNGFLEAFSGPQGLTGPWHGFRDEDGTDRRLPLNHTGTLLAAALGWNQAGVMCGPLVFVGGKTSGGAVDSVGVPELVLNTARELNIQIAEDE